VGIMAKGKDFQIQQTKVLDASHILLSQRTNADEAYMQNILDRDKDGRFAAQNLKIKCTVVVCYLQITATT
jgi:hypothetical protein